MSDSPIKPSQTPNEPRLMDHEYDGIQEYDNPTPGWWSAIFVASVIFAMLYFLYYHSQVPDRSIFDAYDAAAAADFQREFAKMGKLNSDPQSLLSYMHKPDYLMTGRAIFKSNCVSCHGRDGSGETCPNLTDDYYKDVQAIADIPRIIAGGAGSGAMPSWKARGLHDNEIILVAAYVASLRGQNLPSART